MYFCIFSVQLYNINLRGFRPLPPLDSPSVREDVVATSFVKLGVTHLLARQTCTRDTSRLAIGLRIF